MTPTRSLSLLIRSRRWKAFPVALIVLRSLSAPTLLRAQGDPINGTAGLGVALNPITVAVGSPIQVPMTIDLTGVTGAGPSGTTAAVLGAYVIDVSFNSSVLQFTSAVGGGSPGYTSPPTTNVTTGNVRVLFNNGGGARATSPTGLVSVAVLTFTAIGGGSSTITPNPSSLSTNILGDPIPTFGPRSILGSASPATVTVTGGPTPPSPPAYVSPFNGATGVQPPVNLNWTAGAGASSYNVYFGTSSIPPLLTSTSSTSASVATSPATQYFWRIESVNSAGTASGPTWPFTTGSAGPTGPEAPSYLSPVNGATGVTEPVTLSWRSASGATSYNLYLGVSGNPPLIASGLTAASQSVPTRAGTTHYWRVEAVGPSGTTSGPVWFFTTSSGAPEPPGPVPVSRIVPAVISAPGQFGSFFRTAVQMHNPGSTPILGSFVFHRQETSGSASDPSLAFTINPGQTRYYEDILADLGQTGVGSLDVVLTSGPTPVSLVRLFNDAGAGGTTGFVEDMISLSEALIAGDRTILIGPADTNNFRLNVGIRTLGLGASILVSVRDSVGTIVRTFTRDYPPNYFVQTSADVFAKGALPANSSLDITMTQGSAILYGATADNRTQDPSMQIGRKVSP